MITKPRSLVLDIRFFPSLAHDRIDPLPFHISKEKKNVDYFEFDFYLDTVVNVKKRLPYRATR